MRRRPDLIPVLLLMLAVLAASALAAWWLKDHFELAAPQWLWSLALIPLLAAWYVLRRNKRRPAATLSTYQALLHGPVDLLARARHLPFAMGLLGLALMLLAMARPQSKDSWQDVTHEGIDIVIAMDSAPACWPRISSRTAWTPHAMGHALHRRATQRPHRPGGVRGRGLHPMPAHHGPRGAEAALRPGPHRPDHRRHRRGHGPGHRHQPPARKRPPKAKW
jgi:hypothetical protein